MSINTIIKSDGTRVPFDPNKLNKWGEYASANDVPWSDITLTAYKKCYDGCSTKDIHQAMIDACVEKEDEKHLKMAGRLLIGAIYKEAHGGFKSIPTLKDFYHSMVERGLWAEMDYTDEELDKLESVIDHSKNMSKNYSYTALKQMRDKYLIQDLVKRVCYESPQFMFMGVALQGYEKQPKDRRLQDISELYTYLSDLKINVSTPMLVNLRTPKKGLASCCVYTTNDTAESLATGDHIAYMMTCASAGIGSHLTTRSKGDPIRNGAVVHQGKLPYLRMIQSAVHANKQACYDEQTEVLTSSGFKFFKDLKEDDLVAQVHNDGTIDFVIPEDYFVYDVDGELVSFKRDNKDEILVTDNHTMVYQEDDVIDEDNFDEEKLDYDSLFKTCEAGEFETSTSRRFKNSGEIVNKDSSDIDFEDMLATLLLFKQEYKFIENDKTFVGIDISSDSKNNILDFIQNLFKKTGREFYVSESVKDEDIGDSRTIMFDMTNDGYKSIMNRCGTILERLGAPMLRDLLDFIKWIHNDDIVDLNKEQQDYILAIASLSNVTVNIRTIVSEDEETSDKLVVDILPGAPTFIPTSEFTKSLKKYKGKVYCVEVPTNKLIIKRGTETLVCGNSRGGANTTYFSVLDPEINDLIVLKNPTTVLQKRIRDIDYALNVNKLFVEKVAKNEDWYTLSYYHAPDLHDAFYSSDYEHFKELFEKYENHEHATKYKARDLAVKALTESVETGRLYICYIDEMNRHTPFLDPIFSSNLCLEIALPTKGFTGMKDLYGEDPEGEIGLCSLSSIVVGRVTEEEYENVAYHVAMFVDNTIDIMDFPFDSLKYTAQARRSIGIGITNLAYDIANKGLSYTTKEGKEYIHKIAERHAYYLYKASARLGKEKGIADWMYKTKYPTGWLPIDTYNRNVDDVVDNKLTYDWEGLRNEIVGLGGIRNSTVVAIPPNESSSLLTNTTNSIYPVRSLKVIKTSGTNRNILLAPDYERLARKYDIAWNVSTKDLIELYAIVQKFTDQGISADLYVSYKDSQLVSSRTLLTDFIMMMRLGCKSRYYINSQSGVDADYFNKENAEIIDADAFCDSCVL